VADHEEQEWNMKPLEPDFPLAFQTSQCRSADFCAIVNKSNRPINRAPTFYTAILLAFIFSPTAQAANLGRLFFTPEQRAQLDYAYARNAPAQGSASPILTVNGIVQKNGGARTVWVNGIAQSAGNRGERNPTAQSVTIPGKSHPVKIKVGERILLDQAAPSGQHSPAD
jgi:hypothetical protein